MWIRQNTLLLAAIFLAGRPGWADPDSAELHQSLAVLQQVGPKGQGHPPAIAAWKTLSQASPDQLTRRRQVTRP